MPALAHASPAHQVAAGPPEAQQDYLLPVAPQTLGEGAPPPESRPIPAPATGITEWAPCQQAEAGEMDAMQLHPS